MPAEEITVLMRMSERLLGVLIGGMCVVLGYFLFSKLPDKTDSEGKIVLPGGVNIWLSRIGPGVFFAVFGAIIVGISLTSKVETSSVESNSGLTGNFPNSTSSVTAVEPISSATTKTIRAVAFSPSEAETEISKAKTQIYTLNHDWPQVVQKELHSDDCKRIEVAIDYSKRKILQVIWQEKWGSFEDFERWINTGSSLPAPDSIKEPVNIYSKGIKEDAL